MPYFDKDFILRVIDATDLVGLVRAYIPDMKKESGRWVARCHFHDEQSPSFGVKDRPGIKFWKCFGCGAGGDAIKFLRQMENITFPEAVKRLCAKANLPLPEGGSAGDWKPKRAARRTGEEIAAEMKRRKQVALAKRSANALEAILAKYRWGAAEMYEDSLTLPNELLDEARAVLALFPPDDIVWCGMFKHSIAQEDLAGADGWWVEQVKACFRPARDWLSLPTMPGPRRFRFGMRCVAWQTR